MRTAAERPFPIWRTLGVVVLLLLGAVGGELLLIFAQAAASIAGAPLPADGELQSNSGSAWVQAEIAVMEICAAGVTLAFLPSLTGRSNRVLNVVVPTWKIIGAAALAYVATFAFEVAYLSARWFAHQPDHVRSGYEHFAFGSIAEAIFGFAVICLVAPICEEIVFRGFLFNALRAYLPLWLALVVDGGFFSLVHADSILAPTYVFTGMAFAYLYRRTGTIVAPIIAHVLANVVATTLLAQAHR